MNNSKYFLKLQLSNTIKSLFIKDTMGKKKINTLILTNLIFFLPTLALLLIKKDFLVANFKINHIISFYFMFHIGYLLLVFFKKIIANIFLAGDYEIFLSLPIKIKDILLSKIITVNILILAESLFILFSFLGILSIYKVKFYAYILCILSYLITNFLFTLYTYIISIIYLKLNKINKKIKYGLFLGLIILSVSSFSFRNIFALIKKVFLINLIVNSSNMELNILLYILLGLLIPLFGFSLFFKAYKNIIFNLNLSQTLHYAEKNNNTKVKTTIHALIYKDLKKIFGNSNFKQNFIIGNLIFIIFFIISYSILIPKLTDIKITIMFFIALTNIFPSASIVSICLTQNLISMDGQDLELIQSLPVDVYNIMKSKIIVAVIINLPLILVSLILNTIFYRNSPLLMFLSLGATLLTYGTFMIYSIYIDAKAPNFTWFNSKDLLDDFFKTFKILGFSAVIYVPLYLLNVIFKGNYFLILLPTLFNLYLLITTYNKFKITIINTFSFK